MSCSVLRIVYWREVSFGKYFNDVTLFHIHWIVYRSVNFCMITLKQSIDRFFKIYKDTHKKLVTVLPLHNIFWRVHFKMQYALFNLIYYLFNPLHFTYRFHISSTGLHKINCTTLSLLEEMGEEEFSEIKITLIWRIIVE